MALQIIALNHWIVFSDICIVDIMTAQVFASSHTPAPGSHAGRGAAYKSFWCFIAQNRILQ
jgi:hypothetical protein